MVYVLSRQSILSISILLVYVQVARPIRRQWADVSGRLTDFEQSSALSSVRNPCSGNLLSHSCWSMHSHSSRFVQSNVIGRLIVAHGSSTLKSCIYIGLPERDQRQQIVQWSTSLLNVLRCLIRRSFPLQVATTNSPFYPCQLPVVVK